MTNYQTLNELVQKGDKTALEIITSISNNLGNTTLIATIPVADFFRMSLVANERSLEGEAIAQRKLDLKHAIRLGRYILKALLMELSKKSNKIDEREVVNRLLEVVGSQPYVALQPLVGNIRTAGENGMNLRAEAILAKDDTPLGLLKVWLGQQDLIYIVDGQHRRFAIDLVIKFLDEIRLTHKYPNQKSNLSTLFVHGRDDRSISNEELNVWCEVESIIRSSFKVAVELHLGLGIEQERQLFHDLNNLGKPVEKNIALEFDSSNPITKFINDELIMNNIVSMTDHEIKDWNEDDGGLNRKELVSINARLILNATNIKDATRQKMEDRKECAKRFWNVVTQLPFFGQEKWKFHTVIAQPVVLKALAKLTYDFAFGRYRNNESLEKLFNGISTIDFSHNNPLWRYYQLTGEEIQNFKLNGLEDYLPDNNKGNRDIGKYDGEFMRFANRSNDVVPIIGDMIRWELKLPSRN